MTADLTPLAPRCYALHDRFLPLLPALQAAACRRARHVRCPGRRDDLAAEAVALAWAWFLRLAARGRCPTAFPAAFAALAARAAASGRRAAGGVRANDALSPLCQRNRGVRVGPLPDALPAGHPAADALAENTATPVPDQVQFRVDFPAWRAALGGRTRRLMDAMAAGHRTCDLAGMFGVTPARVSQVRRELFHSWIAFLGDDDPAAD